MTEPIEEFVNDPQNKDVIAHGAGIVGYTSN
jgi:hypothetical protein